MSSAPAAVQAGRVQRPPAMVIARRAVNRLTLPVLLVLPSLIIIAGLVGYPLVRTVYLSFTDTGLGELIYGGSTWVGLENYKEVFADEHLRTSLVNTVVFGTACVVGTMALGFAVALLLNQRLKGNLFFGVAVLLPWAVPALAASAIWKWLFDARYGFVNWALVNLGFERFADYAWFADRWSAFFAVFVTVVWQSFPFVALALLAGLQTIPKEMLQAAAVDGAGAWQRFRLVTLPLLRPIVAVLVIFSTIWDFKIFDQIYVMAAGVPDRSADTAAVAAYREGFALSHYGLGSRRRRRAVPDPARVLAGLRAPDRPRGRARMRWLLKRGWMYVRDDRGRGLRAVPDLLDRDHVLEAAVGDLHAHAGPVAVRPAVGPVPARARRGPRRPGADELADRRERDDGAVPAGERAARPTCWPATACGSPGSC